MKRDRTEIIEKLKTKIDAFAKEFGRTPTADEIYKFNVCSVVTLTKKGISVNQVVRNMGLKAYRSNKKASINVKCENSHCNNNFIKQYSSIKKTKHNFCCKSCAATYNNTHKTKGTRVSKLELYLQEQLTLLYPNLQIHYNRKDAINSELDIYIPNLKLAFQLNGIFHYEPIYGLQKLSKIQNNDNRKFQACLEKGIQLCIIDVSKFSYFKKSTAKQYLDIISSILTIKFSKN